MNLDETIGKRIYFHFVIALFSLFLLQRCRGISRSTFSRTSIRFQLTYSHSFTNTSRSEA